MAKIALALTSAIGNTTHDWPTLSDAQMTRFLDFIWDAYPQTTTTTDPVTGVVTVTPKPRNNANLVLAYRAWSNSLWEGTKANVLNYEREKAAQAARDAIGGLVVS